MSDFQPSRPTTPIGREIYDRGVSDSLSEFCDTLDAFLIPAQSGQPAGRAWREFAKRLRSMADEAKGIESR